jgi:beta-N-acetylhexosaminidase
MQDLLRNELGFTGVIVSDDLQMGAITRKWGLAEAVRQAVQAGVDLLTIGNNLASGEADVVQAIAAVEKMLDRDEVDADYIRAAIGRVTTLQEKISGALSWNN